MPDSTKFVLSYIGDFNTINRQIINFERLSAAAAQNLSEKFGQNIQIIIQHLDSLQNRITKTGKIETLAKFSTVFKDAEGQIRTFQNTIKLNEDGLKSLNSSLKNTKNEVAIAVKEFTRLDGASSPLATNFKNLSDINDKFSTQLAKFGPVTEVVSSNLIKTKDATEQTIAVTKLADGNFLKLTETLDKSKVGFQTISRTAQITKSPLKEVSGAASQLATNFKNLSDVNDKFSTQLSKFGKVSSFLGTTLNTVSTEGSKTAKVFGTASGAFVKLEETTKTLPGGIKAVSRNVSELNKVQVANLKTIEKSSPATRTLADEIKTLAGRALLTIPVWLALRGALTSSIQTIKDGLKNIVSFDLALQKVRRNLSGTPEEIEKNFKTLKDSITSFSLQTGISTDTLAESVKKFASLGFEFKEALAGGLGAAKLSVVLFGDAAETSDSFARALNLLIDRSKGAKAPIEQMNELFALTAELEKTNQFEIKEVNESLKNFAGTAKSLGITGKETIAILASLGTNLLEGARGGTLASSAFQQLINNLEDVSAVLGINVNPQVESTTQIFTRVIDEIERLGKTNIVAQTSAINKLFGGLKGARPVRALIADLKRLKENLQIEGDVGKFNKEVQDLVNNSLPKLVDRFHNLNKEAGKAFVGGLVGGEDFAQTMQIINSELVNLIPLAKDAGEVLRAVFAFGTGGVLGLVDFNNTMIQKAASAAPKALDALSKEINAEYLKALNKNLKRSEISALLAQLTTFGANQLQIDPAIFETMVTELQKLLKEAPLEIEVIPTVSDEGLSNEKRQEIANAILKDQLAQLKTRGATSAQLLQQETLLVKQLGISQKEAEILDRQLATQRAIKEEKRLQNKLSSDSIKLFEIAQTEGVDVAKQIGDVLAGKTDFSVFVRRGGEAVEVFKEQFGEIFKQQQAQAFFKGETVPGISGLRGGAGVAIEETALQGLSTALNASAALQKSRIESEALGARELKTTTDNQINALKINTQSLDNLAQVYNAGVPLVGADAQRFVASEATKQKQIIDINVNIDGRNIQFAGSPEAVRQLAAQLTPQIQNAVEVSISNKIANQPESLPAKAVATKIDQF